MSNYLKVSPRWTRYPKRVVMNPKVLLLPALLIAMMSAGQSTAPASNKAATSSVSGVVQNSVTGEPIAHALVQLGGQSRSAVFTDSGGRFEFDQLPVNVAVMASARKPGFLSPYEVDETATLPVVWPGPDAAPVTLKLIPEGVIFGRAQKPDGEPIAYLTVQIFYFQIANGRRKMMPMNSVPTDEDGEFRIAGLRPGTYYLQAGPRFVPTWTGAPGQRARQAAYRPVFYPGVNDLGSAAPLQLSPGQQLEADLALSPDPVFRISGTIGGLPASDGPEEVWPRITILSRDNKIAAIPVQAGSGNDFEAKVPAGSYVVRADVDTPQGPYEGDLPVNVQSDVSGANVMVAPAPQLRVEVAVQRTATEPNRSRRTQEHVNVSFFGQDTNAFTFESTFNDPVIQGLQPGVYSVEITPQNGDFYVESAQCGDVDLLRDNLTVGPGTPPIRVNLRDDGGALAGNLVADGHPAAGTVLLIPDRAPRHIVTGTAGNGGQFHSVKLAPGEYTVLAFDRVAGLEYTNPEVLGAYLANAVHVSVASNTDTRVTVNLIRLAK